MGSWRALWSSCLLKSVYHGGSVCLWELSNRNDLLVGFHYLVFCFCSTAGASQLATRKAPGARGVRGGLPLLWRWHGTRARRQAGALWSGLSRNQQGERERLTCVINKCMCWRAKLIFCFKIISVCFLWSSNVLFFCGSFPPAGGERSRVWDSAAEELTSREDRSVLRLSSGPRTEKTHYFCWVHARGA